MALASEEIPPGTLLGGRYEILDRIGSGGMATVWRAQVQSEQGLLTHTVAIKRMLPMLAHDQSFAEMFLEEARVVSALRHPALVGLYDVGTDAQGVLYIVMEWVAGLDLGAYVARARDRKEEVAWPFAVLVASQVLRGLHQAHAHRDGEGREVPIFHRDVTPSNILLGLHGQAKLTDFGLARAMDRVTLTNPGVVKGKLAYCAPEVLLGERASVHSDLFSLGVVLWEALAGRRLLDGIDERSAFRPAGEREVPCGRDFRAHLPHDLVAIVDRLTNTESTLRFEDALSAARALESVLATAGVRQGDLIGDAVREALGAPPGDDESGVSSQ